MSSLQARAALDRRRPPLHRAAESVCATALAPAAPCGWQARAAAAVMVAELAQRFLQSGGITRRYGNPTARPVSGCPLHGSRQTISSVSRRPMTSEFRMYDRRHTRQFRPMAVTMHPGYRVLGSDCSGAPPGSVQVFATRATLPASRFPIGIGAGARHPRTEPQQPWIRHRDSYDTRVVSCGKRCSRLPIR
jgi:hypothetical protein